MNRRKLNLSGLVLVLACSMVTPLVAQEKRAATGTHHTLWKIQGQQNAVYLLGSIHLLKKEDYPLPTPMEAAFTNSRVVVFETDIGEMEKPEVVMKLATKGMLPAGQTLHDQLTPAVYLAFSNHIQKAGMPAELFESFTPAMAAISLVALELKKLGLDPEQGLDKYFYGRAREENKTIVPLETLDFQINLMTEFSKEEGELLMKSTLKDIEKMESEFGELLKAWHTGDGDKLEKMLNEAMEEAPVIYKRLLTDRNQRWVPKIEELARGKENAIIIVGAGHLVGSNGVVELLKKKGYKVVQQ
jgi:uncharacterized protein YbaP (TraB family)